MGKGSLVLMSGQPGACPLPSLIAPTERERKRDWERGTPSLAPLSLSLPHGNAKEGAREEREGVLLSEG